MSTKKQDAEGRGERTGMNPIAVGVVLVVGIAIAVYVASSQSDTKSTKDESYQRGHDDCTDEVEDYCRRLASAEERRGMCRHLLGGTW